MPRYKEAQAYFEEQIMLQREQELKRQQSDTSEKITVQQKTGVLQL